MTRAEMGHMDSARRKLDELGQRKPAAPATRVAVVVELYDRVEGLRQAGHKLSDIAAALEQVLPGITAGSLRTLMWRARQAGAGGRRDPRQGGTPPRPEVPESSTPRSKMKAQDDVPGTDAGQGPVPSELKDLLGRAVTVEFVTKPPAELDGPLRAMGLKPRKDGKRWLWDIPCLTPPLAAAIALTAYRISPH